MNALSIAVFAVVLACASAGAVGYIGSVAHGAGLQGPGSHIAIIGPDGSHIDAGTDGGAVVAPGVHGGAIAGVGHIGYGVGLGLGLGVGGGHEGQYVPSGLERLYDDGSYRGDYYGGGHDYDDGDDGHYWH